MPFDLLLLPSFIYTLLEHVCQMINISITSPCSIFPTRIPIFPPPCSFFFLWFLLVCQQPRWHLIRYNTKTRIPNFILGLFFLFSLSLEVSTVDVSFCSHHQSKREKTIKKKKRFSVEAEGEIRKMDALPSVRVAARSNRRCARSRCTVGSFEFLHAPSNPKQVSQEIKKGRRTRR